ncbi:MarR family winged helix-turn-helix transcriptional regulator [Micromonospora sp. NBC_01813]|uniref:MarR family winged helix-turn-helix transcriptional regulator n=1 Tax=Micromonospora sp. NBC_01813 TaxID=2975988 RepID=UPI002DD813FB|nr:MarR family transcriptional regulator [Micromonospora sp. NBC_01813]WSA06145.1 MarR family transcriptional regulator [Micromonospora sp. NBC_01813]
MPHRPEPTVTELGLLLWRYAQEAHRLQAAVGDQLDLHVTDLTCLAALTASPGITAGELAQRLAVTSGAVTRMTDRLAERGYVRRSVDPADRRRVLLEVTGAAVAEVGPAYQSILSDLARSAADCTDEQLRFLVDFMRGRIAACAQETQQIRQGGRAAAQRSRVIATSTP